MESVTEMGVTGAMSAVMHWKTKIMIQNNTIDNTLLSEIKDEVNP